MKGRRSVAMSAQDAPTAQAAPAGAHPDDRARARAAGTMVVARRLRGKQPPPDGGLGAICDLAITAQSRREIAWLAGDAQRQHAHFIS